MASKKSSSKRTVSRIQSVQNTASKATHSAWDSLKAAASKPAVRDTAVLAGQATLCTLVAVGTLKALSAAGAAMA
jgi:hypothetical protein